MLSILLFTLMIAPFTTTALSTSSRIGIIGSGASGVFTALVAAESAPPTHPPSITVFEQTKFQLSKVKISGGGRCNVLHDPSDFDVKKSYPRGFKELVSPLSTNRFSPIKMKQWWEEHGLQMHTEADGRMFPTSNKSSSVINVLLDNCKRLGVEFNLGRGVKHVR